MQSLGLVLVVCVLMTHNEVSSKPWETTTTARYNNYEENENVYLSNNTNHFQPSASSIFFNQTSSSRRAKTLDPLYLNVLMVNNEVIGRKLSSSPSNYHSLVVSNLEKKPANNTFKIRVVNAVNSVKVKPVNNAVPTKVGVRTTTVASAGKRKVTIRKKIASSTHVPVRRKTVTTRKPTLKKSSTRIPVRRVSTSPTKSTVYKISANRRPVVQKITQWSEIKQNWADVPSPSPQPEIISYSPEFPINNVGSEPAVTPPTPDSSSLSNPLSQFNLDVLPSTAENSAAADCPTVHISSNMLSPLQRQGCSDINVVLNSHFHQNSPTQRVPTAENDPGLAEAVEADPVEDIGAAEADVPAEAPAADAPAADPPVPADPGGASGTPAASSGGTPGGGGSPGGGSGGGPPSLPELPELPMLPEFDLKGMMDFLSWAGGGLGNLLNFFKNPWLYLVPIALFFSLGFLLVIALFPWWIPLLFVFAGSNSKSNVAYYKHIHKPIHHPDGWFWNHNTKTWNNVVDYVKHRHRRIHSRSISLDYVPKQIEEFAEKYENTRSWKRRKK